MTNDRDVAGVAQAANLAPERVSILRTVSLLLGDESIPLGIAQTILNLIVIAIFTNRFRAGTGAALERDPSPKPASPTAD